MEAASKRKRPLPAATDPQAEMDVETARSVAKAAQLGSSAFARVSSLYSTALQVLVDFIYLIFVCWNYYCYYIIIIIIYYYYYYYYDCYYIIIIIEIIFCFNLEYSCA